MRVCYRVNGQPMTCAANTMCFTAYEDFRRGDLDVFMERRNNYLSNVKFTNNKCDFYNAN